MKESIYGKLKGRIWKRVFMENINFSCYSNINWNSKLFFILTVKTLKIHLFLKCFHCLLRCRVFYIILLFINHIEIWCWKKYCFCLLQIVFPVRMGLWRAISFMSWGVLNICFSFSGWGNFRMFHCRVGHTLCLGVMYCLVTVLYLLLYLALPFPVGFVFLNSWQ